MPGGLVSPAMDAVLTTWPSPWARSSGTKDRMPLITPNRLTPRTQSQYSCGISDDGGLALQVAHSGHANGRDPVGRGAIAAADPDGPTGSGRGVGVGVAADRRLHGRLCVRRLRGGGYRVLARAAGIVRVGCVLSA